MSQAKRKRTSQPLGWSGSSCPWFKVCATENMANFDRYVGTLLLDGEGEYVQTSDALCKKKYVM